MLKSSKSGETCVSKILSQIGNHDKKEESFITNEDDVKPETEEKQ